MDRKEYVEVQSFDKDAQTYEVRVEGPPPKEDKDEELEGKGTKNEFQKYYEISNKIMANFRKTQKGVNFQELDVTSPFSKTWASPIDTKKLKNRDFREKNVKINERWPGINSD